MVTTVGELKLKWKDVRVYIHAIQSEGRLRNQRTIEKKEMKEKEGFKKKGFNIDDEHRILLLV